MDTWNVNDSWYEAYINVCRLAASDDRYFNIFKSHPSYNLILEHVDYEQGLSYLKEIEKNPKIMSWIDQFKANDILGGTKLYEYSHNNIGLISPSTLRYIKVLCDLHNLFGDLNNFNICEIGGGYGGQCKIIDIFYDIKSYTIVDLEDVNRLSKLYLTKIGTNTNIRHLTYPVDVKSEYDLVISNYAFSELPKHVQDNYMFILKNSKHGYVTFNNESTDNAMTYHANDVKNIIKNSTIIKETPETLHDNAVLYW